MKKTVFTILTLILYLNCSASEGCLSVTNVLYRNYAFEYGGIPYYHYRSLADRFPNPQGTYCITPIGSFGSCFITETTQGYERGGFGTLVSYPLLPCPIDDFLALIFIPLAAVGFFKINGKISLPVQTFL